MVKRSCEGAYLPDSEPRLSYVSRCSSCWRSPLELEDEGLERMGFLEDLRKRRFRVRERDFGE